MVTVSTSKSYHHGDLRAALIQAGLKALESQGLAELSLRQLAREVGVSPTAVYRHFPDKQALLDVLAQVGLEQLAQWQQAATQAQDSANSFAATGRAYVRWALANPALFRLAFGQRRSARDTLFGENAAARMLREHAFSQTGSDAGVQRLMIQAWAIVHGLAMLMLDGQIPADDALIDQAIDAKTLFGA
jgi:AcrR family transcriptional regulator